MWPIRIAISLILASAAIFIAIKTGILLIAWKWLIGLKAFAKLYAMRQLQAPVWRVIYKTLIVVFGLRAMQIMRGYTAIVVDWGKTQIARWQRLPLWFRVTIGVGALIGFGFAGIGLYILPIWLPLLKPIVRKIHMMWMDRVVDRYVRPVRQRYRRFMRTNPVFGYLRWPHRLALYWMVISIRRVGRIIRKKVEEVYALYVTRRRTQ